MPVLPSPLTAILSLLRPTFTAPTFQIFEALTCGFIGRIGEHTIYGMWQAGEIWGGVEFREVDSSRGYGDRRVRSKKSRRHERAESLEASSSRARDGARVGTRSGIGPGTGFRPWPA